jgi:glycosyltransferase involved in cell wall biosynthesis
VFTLILPVHNEEKKIEPCVNKIVRLFRSKEFKGYGPYEIIVAEDGSRDRSAEIGKQMQKKYREVRFFHSEQKLGRGRAVKQAIEKARGDRVGYMDVDMATDISHLKELIASLDNYDVVTGSRYLSGSSINRTKKRMLFSKGYNGIVRIVLGSKVHDHQCGFKSFKKSSISRVNKFSKANHWFWDTESLVIANKLGMKVKEFPVRWRESGTTTVRFRKDIIDFLAEVINLRLRLWKYAVSGFNG